MTSLRHWRRSKKRVLSEAKKIATRTAIYPVLDMQDQIGLLQSLEFSSPSASISQKIKDLEQKRDAYVEEKLADASVAADEKAQLQRFRDKFINATFEKEIKPTEEDHAEKAAKLSEADKIAKQLLDEVLQTPEEKESYAQALKEAEQEYQQRFGKTNTFFSRLFQK